MAAPVPSNFQDDGLDSPAVVSYNAIHQASVMSNVDPFFLDGRVTAFEARPVRRIRPFFETFTDYTTRESSPQWGQTASIAFCHDSNGGQLMERPRVIFTLPACGGTNVCYQDGIGYLMFGSNMQLKLGQNLIVTRSQDSMYYEKELLSDQFSLEDMDAKRRAGWRQNLLCAAQTQVLDVEVPLPFGTGRGNRLVCPAVSDDLLLTWRLPAFADVCTRARCGDVSSAGVVVAANSAYVAPGSAPTLGAIRLRARFTALHAVEALMYTRRALAKGGISWKVYFTQEEALSTLAFTAPAAVTTTATAQIPLISINGAVAALSAIVRYSRDLSAVSIADAGGVPVLGSKTDNACPQRLSAAVPVSSWRLLDNNKAFTETMTWKEWNEYGRTRAGFRCEPNNQAVISRALNPRDSENCSGHFTPSSMNSPKFELVVMARPNGTITAGGSLGDFPDSDPWARAYGNAVGANPALPTGTDTHFDKSVYVMALVHNFMTQRGGVLVPLLQQ